ncbi:MAG: methionyl-tRNA formyltransferase, partial [Oscillospiraceae bacterium]|nr:methionyl-tRNA formyltransferase [Oscillospiraceae bacterium]
YTREDKPVGRKQVLTPPPVKVVAQQHNIPVFQPKSLRNATEADNIQALAPQLIVVVAYGRILPKEILDIPAYGCINLHVSLLPKYRGAAPIQWSVINGDAATGVTITYMDEGLDTGDIICVAPVAIGSEETAGELFLRVAAQGTATLCEAIASIENGTATRTPQNHSQATQAPPLTKEMACFDFTKPAQQLHNLIRGLNPWPMAYFLHEDKKVKVQCATVVDQKGAVGEILSTKPLVVACETQALQLCRVVPEGKGAMDAEAWALGRRFTVGDKF